MRGVIAVCLGAALLAGCIQPPTEHTALGTNVPLGTAAQANLGETAPAGTRVWLAPDRSHYVPKNILIEPVKVDMSKAAQFSGVQPEQVAATLTTDVRRALSARFPVTNMPGPGTHTLELTLVQAVAPHVAYMNYGPYPVLAQAQGMPNQTTEPGHLLIAGKTLDTTTGKQLSAFIVPVSPPDMLMSAQPGAQGAQMFVQDASQSFADSLTASFLRAVQSERQAAAEGQ